MDVARYLVGISENGGDDQAQKGHEAFLQFRVGRNLTILNSKLQTGCGCGIHIVFNVLDSSTPMGNSQSWGPNLFLYFEYEIVIWSPNGHCTDLKSFVLEATRDTR